MPRQARVIGESGYLHVIVRGIGKQLLFEDERDYLYFLKILARYSEETCVTINAYCLMENHVHLLVHDTNGKIALMMKKLGVSYSYYFNHKYERSGHLFQDRYRSEAIHDDAYLLTVFRYILNNPQKAGICRAEDYRWSSYHAYGKPDKLVSTSLLRELIGDDDAYAAFVAVRDDEECMEFSPVVKNDEWAQKVIRKKLHGESGTSLQREARSARDAALRELKEAGLSVRQLERLTGISRGIIQNA